MKLPPPVVGAVIKYSYLWAREDAKGMIEGLKDRPAVIVAAVEEDASGKTVYVLPVTHTPPDNALCAHEIPPQLKRHLGLDDQRSWIICDEVNAFAWPGWDVRHVSHKQSGYGQLPGSFLRQIKEKYLHHMDGGALKIVNRDDPPKPLARR